MKTSSEHHGKISQDISLVLKFNNCVSHDPCGICGCRTEQSGGLDVFLEGTYRPVCLRCIREYGPEFEMFAGLHPHFIEESADRLMRFAARDGTLSKDGREYLVEGDRQRKRALETSKARQPESTDLPF